MILKHTERRTLVSIIFFYLNVRKSPWERSILLSVFLLCSCLEAAPRPIHREMGEEIEDNTPVKNTVSPFVSGDGWCIVS